MRRGPVGWRACREWGLREFGGNLGESGKGIYIRRSTVSLIAMTVTTTSSMARTKPVPFVITMRAPICAPTMLATARMIPNFYITTPLRVNTTRAPRFVDVLKIFAIVTDSMKLRPRRAVSTMMRKVPVPGPKKPS